MPIIRNISDASFEYNFVFIENNIAVKEFYDGSALGISKERLPDRDFLERCLKAQIAVDWYAEPEQGCCAMALEKDAPLLSGYIQIPLRQFFWETMSDRENFGQSFLGTLAARAHGFLGLRQTYIFCPKCGTKLELDSRESAKVCPKCGRLDFPRIEPATITLVTRGDELLLVRPHKRTSGFYGLVSGFVEMGESIEQCAVREVKEETNIDIKNLRYAGSQSWPFPNQLMLAFTAEYAGGELKLQESEIADGGWFTRDNLPEIPRQGSIAYNLITKFLNGDR